MCQVSIEELRSNIEENISTHLNESKLLNEWYYVLNENLPRSRRLSQRELANLFKVFKRTGRFSVEHLGRSYAFRQAV